MKQQEKRVEFARPVAVEEIGAGGFEAHLQATPDERRLLARRLGLDDLLALEATARLTPVAGDRMRVDVDFSAEVLQSCVVSLEPVTSRIEDSFVELFAPDVDPDEGEVVVEAVGEDPPEAIVGGMIDVGELVVQYLSLAIDPYPRRPEVSGEALPADVARFLASSDDTAADRDDGMREGDRGNPFAALSALRRADGNGSG